MTLATGLRVHPLSPTIGAEIEDVDLSVPLAPEVVAAVRQALNTHHVIFFRDQSLTPEQQADFGRQFGEVTEAHPVLPAIAESTKVLAIDGKVDRASWWHTDVTFLETPAMGSILYMLEAPEVGGDTMWASMQDAYDGLAPVVRTMCDGLIAIHYDPWFAADVEARGGYEWNGTWREKLLPALHPVVRTHPETGRNGLFVNGQFTQSVLGTLQEREQCHTRDALPALRAARIHLPLPLEARLGCLLGQPGHAALRAGRLRRRPPVRAPDHLARRPSLRARPSCPPG